MKASTAAWATPSSFDAFRAGAMADGFDEAVSRDWAPDMVVETHTHAFDAEAVVVEGEMWLSNEAGSRRLGVGDTFALTRGTPHAERYGPQGATYWVARRLG